MRKLVLLSLLLAAVSGCTTLRELAEQDPRDAPWDPKPSSGITLMDQLPPWDHSDRCAGHLPPNQRKSHQTGRC